MSLLPKEHGAYGQISFPLLTAFSVGGVSAPGLLLTTTIVAGFLAHEPAAVVLGWRGPRAQRELGGAARRHLYACVAVGAVTGLAALLLMAPPVRWSVLVPSVPALALAMATLRGRDKSWQGEVAAALAFSGAAVPVAMAGGSATRDAASIAIPFALLFVASTLAVRVVVLRVRGGGNTAATDRTRRATFVLAGGAIAVLGGTIAMGYLSAFVLAAAAPGLLTAAAVAARPPAPTRLRRLGWTLVAVSVLTTAIVIATV